MKNLLFTTIIFCIFYITVQAQSENYISGKIQDKDGNPISYVNVGIVGTSTGTVSREDGSFKLFLENLVEGRDTVRFSIIGYKSQSYLMSDIEDQLVVSLEEDIIKLNEVVIRPELLNQKTVGYAKTEASRGVNFSISDKPHQNLGAEIGKKFKVRNIPTKIESIRFFIQSNNFSSVKFRISLYEVKGNMPCGYLTDRDIIVDVAEKKTGWIDVDLSAYDVFTENDFIATVQWIDSSADGKRLSMPISFPALGRKHYYKYGSQAEWRRYKNMSTSMTAELVY